MPREPFPMMPSGSGELPFLPSFHKEMNRLIEHFRSGFPVPDTAVDQFHGAPLFPPIDIIEQDGVIEISVEMPGVQTDTLEASITGEILTLKGKKPSEHTDKDGERHRAERCYGAFKREVPLGFEPENGAVEAHFKDGILKLRIARSTPRISNVRKINIVSDKGASGNGKRR